MPYWHFDSRQEKNTEPETKGTTWYPTVKDFVIYIVLSNSDMLQCPLENRVMPILA